MQGVGIFLSAVSMSISQQGLTDQEVSGGEEGKVSVNLSLGRRSDLRNLAQHTEVFGSIDDAVERY